MRDLRGKAAILTGATGGLGPHIAQALAKQGVNLLLTALPGNELEQLRSAFPHVQSVVMPADLLDPGAPVRIIERALNIFGSVEILVNNAGAEIILPYHTVRIDEINQIVTVNLTVPMILARLVVPQMLGRKEGHVVNISSLAAKAGMPCSEPYVAAKAGLNKFTQSFRAEYRSQGISASIISPGFVECGIYQTLTRKTGLSAPRLLGRSTPEAVANAVIRAIKFDLPEIIVNPRPTRIFSALSELFPCFSEALLHFTGVASWFKKVADIQRRSRGLS